MNIREARGECYKTDSADWPQSFATLGANILQIPMSTANGLGLKVSETLHLKNHRILQFLFGSLAGIKFL